MNDRDRDRAIRDLLAPLIWELSPEPYRETKRREDEIVRRLVRLFEGEGCECDCHRQGGHVDRFGACVDSSGAAIGER